MARTVRVIAVEHAKRFIGKPYYWGGQGPLGFDCSGLMVEICRAVGLLNRTEDYTAAGLYARFADKEIDTVPQPGCMVFYGASKEDITHVGMVVEVTEKAVLMIEAVGGRSGVDTAEEAQQRDAQVTIRPRRADVVATVDPFRAAA